MEKDEQLGLDELMIVNPSSSSPEALFLGADGILYQVEGLGDGETPERSRQFLLGDDGTLYQVQDVHADGSAKRHEISGGQLEEENSRDLGRYFLGADGALYEVVR